jgi:glucose/arabinose dehydrogenase
MIRPTRVIQAGAVVASLTAAHVTTANAFDGPDTAAKRVLDPHRVSVSLEPVVTGLRRPVAVRNAGDGSSRLFIVEQPGLIRIVDGSVLRTTAFLDISGRVRDSSNEQGLLGLAFHPDYENNGRFFVNYTDLDGNTVVSEFSRSDGDPNRADPMSEMIIITIEQPRSNHNGGDVAFGPDGYLWIATGDGGGSGDPDGNGQNKRTLLGKLLRIDVDRGSTYTIPPDNPFIDDPEARNEIWAFGLRNPWRFSFDRSTSDLFIGDVGQGTYEEIDFEARQSSGGRNYGWNIMEGSHCFQNGGCSSDGITLPIAEYDHDSGCSVTGGYVYRGGRFPALRGMYLFGDYCSGTIWALAPSDTNGWFSAIVSESDARISSFGEDEDGELYVADLASGAVYKVTGRTSATTPRRPERRSAPSSSPQYSQGRVARAAR